MGPIRSILAIAAMAALAPAAWAQDRLQIQFAEPITVTAAPGHAQFDAYGRRFAMDLVSNERLVARMSAARKQDLSQARLLRGKLAGNARSWVRLTRFDGRVEGAIWDGNDLYAVTSFDRVAPYLSTPLRVADIQTVVYRLSDTLNALPAAFCASAPAVSGLPSNNGLVQYRKLMSELSASSLLSTPLTREIEISLISDAAFRASYTNSNTEMLARFNIAEGIFGEQTGLLLAATDVQAAPAAPDPFTSTVPSTLLDQLSTYRRGNSAALARGIAHLVTGKDLDGDTAGIARISGACDADNGVSLSEGWLQTGLAGLVMAHELAHNLGAEHDGVAGQACAATPQTFLMSPALNGSSEFSACSLTAMRAVIDNGSCIRSASYAHVELAPGPLETLVEINTPVVLSYTVSSTGTLAAQDVRFEVDGDARVPVTAVNPSAGCNIQNGALSCDLGNLSAGAQRTFDVTLTPASLGTVDLTARTTAVNNQHTRDSTQTRRVAVDYNVDGAIAISATPTTVISGDAVDYQVTVRSLRSAALTNTRVNLQAGGMAFVSATGATCNAQGLCQLGDIPGGQQRQFTLRYTSAGTGRVDVFASLQADNDPISSNNSANVSVTVEPRRDVALEAVDPNQLTNFGEPFTFRANLRALGIEPLQDVTLQISISAPVGTFDGIDSVTIGGVACLPAPVNFYQCAVGGMPAGEIREIRIEGRGVALGTYGFNLRAGAAQQDNLNNDQLARGVTVMHPVDVEVSNVSTSGGTESIAFQSTALISSNGRLPVTSSRITVSVPAQVRIVSHFLDGVSCTLVDAQHLECPVSFESAGTRRFLYWNVISDVPGAHTATVSVSTPGDAVAANDSRTLVLNVSSIVDIGVNEFTVPAYLLADRDHEVPATVVTGMNDVPNASLRIVAQVGAQVRAVTAGGFSCVRESDQRMNCPLGTLAARTTLPVVVTLAARGASSTALLTIAAESPADNNASNNTRNAQFRFVDAGDLRVNVAATSVAAIQNVTFAHPRISIRRTGPAVEGRLNITLPAGLAVNSLSAGVGLCTGTTQIQCTLPSSWPEDQALEFDLTLTPGAVGNFTTQVSVTSVNDTNPANDTTSVAVTVTAPAPPVTPPVNPPATPPSGGGSAGGGGGGGRFEWLALAFLAGVVAQRARRPHRRRLEPNPHNSRRIPAPAHTS